jgi:hypothetical protein
MVMLYWSTYVDWSKPTSCQGVAWWHLDAEQLVLPLVVDDAINFTAHNDVQLILGVQPPATIPA